MEALDCKRCLAGVPWDRVDQEAIRGNCGDCVLAYNMPTIEHAAYYLPAFLDALLATWPAIDDCYLYLNAENQLTDTAKDAPLPRALTQRQRRCVAEFLFLLADDPILSLEEDGARYRLAAEEWDSERWGDR